MAETLRCCVGCSAPFELLPLVVVLKVELETAVGVGEAGRRSLILSGCVSLYCLLLATPSRCGHVQGEAESPNGRRYAKPQRWCVSVRCCESSVDGFSCSVRVHWKSRTHH